MNLPFKYILLKSIFRLAFLHNLYEAHILKTYQTIPPLARFRYSPKFLQQNDAAERFSSWDSNDGSNIWEHSGLFEGDIMIYRSSQLNKNGLLNSTSHWPGAVVPYFIDDTFSDEELIIILGAMQEYHNKTCIRFRPYTKNDTNWIEIKSDQNGCWSSVGMQMEGQVINLHSPKCIRHGVVVHELLHALGFYHQQSSADRDDFVIIHWENIRAGRERNFNKYNTTTVTDYNITYDYESVMHYSAKAFSKNGNITIQPLQEVNVTLGQRVGLSLKDVLKINFMYNDDCNNDTINIFDKESIDYPVNHLYTIIKWVENTLGSNLIS